MVCVCVCGCVCVCVCTCVSYVYFNIVDRARDLLTSTPVRISNSLHHHGKLPGKVQLVIRYSVLQPSMNVVLAFVYASM